MKLLQHSKHSLFAPFPPDSKTASRECFQKFFGQFWRQSRSNQRSQVDAYWINTDQLAKLAVVDFSELSRSKLPQNLLKTLPCPTFPSMFCEAVSKSDKKRIKNQIFRMLE
jgi:hypothetical protein